MPRKRRPSEQVPAGTYEKLTEERGEVCWICGAAPKTRRLHIDHDHGVKDELRVRGILCARCNRNLPSWITPEWCLAAALYLTGVRPEPGDVFTLDLITPEEARKLMAAL